MARSGEHEGTVCEAGLPIEATRTHDPELTAPALASVPLGEEVRGRHALSGAECPACRLYTSDAADE
jgi:hypothetical protein